MTMPLSASGRKILARMKDEYGDKKGEEVFYASINAHKRGSEKWHGKKRKK
jgi:hypothetical protein